MPFGDKTVVLTGVFHDELRGTSSLVIMPCVPRSARTKVIPLLVIFDSLIEFLRDDILENIITMAVAAAAVAAVAAAAVAAATIAAVTVAAATIAAAAVATVTTAAVATVTTATAAAVVSWIRILCLVFEGRQSGRSCSIRFSDSDCTAAHAMHNDREVSSFLYIFPVHLHMDFVSSSSFQVHLTEVCIARFPTTSSLT